MTFVAGDDVCTPITVTVSGKSYRVSSSLTISQVNGYVKAVDCNGRKLKYDFSKTLIPQQYYKYNFLST